MNGHPDILCISSIDWDFIWQGHQEIMSRLAADGHRVLFVENTGVRTPKVRDLPRVRQRVRNWWRGTKGFRQERPNLFIYSPLLLPWPYLRPSRWINGFMLKRALRRWMDATGFFQPIAWTFLPTPLARDLLAAVKPRLTIYYCIDDFASSSTGARRIVASEERLFKDADLVFVTSERLRERAARFSNRVHVFPFGVSLERFEAVRRGADDVPADLATLRRPVVGYVGGLHQWIDQSLVSAAAETLPDATFALIGPEQTDVTLMRERPNVRLLGLREHHELPRYIQGFDVGIVPYRLTEYTANVYPTKLNEYLAMGIPVVATDLPEIRQFNVDHGDIVAVASDVSGFAAAIRQALIPAGQREVERRVAVAQSNSWRTRMSAMQRLIDAGIERRAATNLRWDETLLRVYRQTRTRIAQAVIGLAALYLLVFNTNLLWWCARPLFVEAAPTQADAIVVFAGGVGESGKAGGGAQERLARAVELYRAKFAPVLILSSGYVYSFHEADVMRAMAIDQGVPDSAIMLEQRATNTFQNVKFVDDILRDRRWTRILLVSSPYHMRRAVLVWQKQDPEVQVVPTPVQQSQFYDHTRGANLEQVRGIIQEYVAILGYWRRGWL